MHKYKFFVIAMLIGVGCFQYACAMELVDMSHVWSEDYTKNIGEIKNIDLKAMRSNLKKLDYLSPHAKTLDHLLYFSTIDKNSQVKTLFTQKQQDRFDTAARIKWWVPCCFGINATIIGFTAFLPFTSAIGLLQCANVTQDDCLSQTSVLMSPAAISMAGALVVGFSSLYATGLSPDWSARKADKVQDEVGNLSRRYSTIAKYWIDIYFNCPEQARYIAAKFDIDELKKRVTLKTYKAKSAHSLLNPLEEAWHFIKHNTILETFTEIESYVYNKINTKRIAALEKKLHEKNAEMERINKKRYEKK